MGWLNELLNLRGPEFLGTYVILGGIALALIPFIIMARREMKDAGEPEGKSGLGPYELVYLAKGAGGAARAAVARLIHAQVLVVNQQERTLSVRDGSSGSFEPFERDVIYATRVSGQIEPAKVGRAVFRSLEDIHESLVRKGYLNDARERLNVVLLASVPIVAVLLLGFAKMVVGFERGKPIGFLILLSLCFGVVWLCTLPWMGKKTAAGVRETVRVQEDSHPIRITASRSAARLQGLDIAMVAGIYGIGALAGEDWTALKKVYAYTHGGDVSGGFVDSGAGAGCSSGGGGCGGGGCGGCGG